MSRWRAESTYLGRHVGSGALNTLVGFAVIFVLMWLGVSPYISNVAGYAVGFIFGFVLSKKFVFRSNGHFVTEGVRYFVAFLISFLCNLLILHYLLINFSALASQIAAAAGYTVIMYLLARTFVFNIGGKSHPI